MNPGRLRRLVLGAALVSAGATLAAQEPLMRSPNPTPAGPTPTATPVNRTTPSREDAPPQGTPSQSTRARTPGPSRR